MYKYFIIIWDAFTRWIRDFNNDFSNDFAN